MVESDGLIYDQDDSQRWAGRPELAWASLAFAEPKLGGPRIEPIRGGTWIGPEKEILFYCDWQTRDSELALELIDRRTFELLKTAATLRGGLQRRLRSVSLARTRQQALEMINAGEPNPRLRYPTKVFEDLQIEITRLTAEVSYLHSFSARIGSLQALLTRLLDMSGGNLSSELEQSLRLLGQSWRGQMRVRGWSERVPKSMRRKPTLTVFQPDYMNFSGYIVSLQSVDESIILSEETAGYLLSQLEVIALLAREAEDYLKDPANARDTWFPVLALLRAIVEFFYFCNFELPFAYGHLALDGVVPEKVWTYRDEWIAAKDDETSVRRLKRMSAEVASLLIEHERLLECETEEELAELLKAETLPRGQSPTRVLYQPYRAVGLASFEFAESEQRVRFHTPPEAIGELVANLLEDQPHLARLASSGLGGPLETLLGLALLDERAFGSTSLQLETRIRYEQLARFWRSVGRRRAIVMLGDSYVQAISEALSVLGQPGPDHPTFLTVRFGAAPGAEVPFDPFSSLVLADQVRLMELLNITWSFGEKFLERLGQVGAAGAPAEVISALPLLAASFEGDLRLRLNESWLVSLDSVWALLRGCAPVLWDFWSKLKSEENWQQPIMAAPAEEATGLMLRLFGDSLRLIMLVELSGVMMLTRLRYGSEICAQKLYRTAAPFQAADPERASAIARAVDYYFDAEIRFDTVIAFASAFRQYLDHMLADLKLLGADEKQCGLFVTLIGQLDENYGLGAGNSRS